MIRIVFAMGCMAALVTWLAIHSTEPELAKIHKEIQVNFQSVEHIDASNYSDLDTDNLVVFDVREPDEFAVSHLDGAIQIDPAISPAEFSEQYEDILRGKTAVFYCSVGWRSSDVAQRLSSTLTNQGVAASYNLIGGLFQWHNEERPLMSESGSKTEAIHPYNSFWGRLIDDQSAIQTVVE